MTTNLQQRFEEVCKDIRLLTRVEVYGQDQLLAFIKAELESLADEIYNNPQMRVSDQKIAAAIIRNRGKETKI